MNRLLMTFIHLGEGKNDKRKKKKKKKKYERKEMKKNKFCQVIGICPEIK